MEQDDTRRKLESSNTLLTQTERLEKRVTKFEKVLDGVIKSARELEQRMIRHLETASAENAVIDLFQAVRRYRKRYSCFLLMCMQEVIAKLVAVVRKNLNLLEDMGGKTVWETFLADSHLHQILQVILREEFSLGPQQLRFIYPIGELTGWITEKRMSEKRTKSHGQMYLSPMEISELTHALDDFRRSGSSSRQEAVGIFAAVVRWTLDFREIYRESGTAEAAKRQLQGMIDTDGTEPETEMKGSQSALDVKHAVSGTTPRQHQPTRRTKTAAAKSGDVRHGLQTVDLRGEIFGSLSHSCDSLISALEQSPGKGKNSDHDDQEKICNPRLSLSDPVIIAM